MADITPGVESNTIFLMLLVIIKDNNHASKTVKTVKPKTVYFEPVDSLDCFHTAPSEPRVVFSLRLLTQRLYFQNLLIVVDKV